MQIFVCRNYLENDIKNEIMDTSDQHKLSSQCGRAQPCRQGEDGAAAIFWMSQFKCFPGVAWKSGSVVTTHLPQIYTYAYAAMVEMYYRTMQKKISSVESRKVLFQVLFRLHILMLRDIIRKHIIEVHSYVDTHLYIFCIPSLRQCPITIYR